MEPFLKALLEVDMEPYNKARRRNKAIKRRRKQIKRKRRETAALLVAAHAGRAMREMLK